MILYMKAEMESENPEPVADQVNRETSNEDEKAMHEGFMREALAVVHQLFAALCSSLLPTSPSLHHPQIT